MVIAIPNTMILFKNHFGIKLLKILSLLIYLVECAVDVQWLTGS